MQDLKCHVDEKIVDLILIATEQPVNMPQNIN